MAAPYIINVSYHQLRTENFENLLNGLGPVFEEFGFVKLCPPKGFWKDKLYEEDLTQDLGSVYQQTCTNWPTKIGKKSINYQTFTTDRVKGLSLAEYRLSTLSTEKNTLSNAEFYAAMECCDTRGSLYAADVSGSRIKNNKFVYLWNLPTTFTYASRRAAFVAPGVTTPMVYYGSRFSKINSRFNWHTEDQILFSIAVHISGDTKTWNVIPLRHKGKFEKFAQILCPQNWTKSDDSEDGCPAYLMHKEFCLDSKYLKPEGIDCYSVEQNTGEITITAPG